MSAPPLKTPIAIQILDHMRALQAMEPELAESHVVLGMTGTIAANVEANLLAYRDHLEVSARITALEGLMQDLLARTGGAS
jgi:hypothetical protein